jgi:hypothetical protein
VDRRDHAIGLQVGTPDLVSQRLINMLEARPWLRIIPDVGRVHIICEMCQWHYQPRTRNGVAKAIRIHLDCGFLTLGKYITHKNIGE